jgi:hypothetical protein
MRWEYEPQGYLVGEERRPYLPDFRLPDIGWWIEVKGSQGWLDLGLLADAVHPTKGMGGDGNLMILGAIPEVADAGPLHYTITRDKHCGQLHRCNDGCDFPPTLYGLHTFLAAADLERLGADLSAVKPSDLAEWQRWGAMPIPVGRPSVKPFKGDLTLPMIHPSVQVGPHVAAAYDLGRTARFEHGEAA